MRLFTLAMILLTMALALGSTTRMLPPDTFKDPIFAANDDNGSDDNSRDSGYSEFA